MQQPQNIRQLLISRRKDYISFTLFFFIFSLFVIFIIRPSLTEAFSLKKEEADLKEIDAKFQRIIINIVEMQKQLEQQRDALYLLSDALPSKPQINQIINDVVQSADKHAIIVKKLTTDEISLMEKGKADKKFLQRITIRLEALSTYDNTIRFIQDLFNKRRIKSIRELRILNKFKVGGIASESALLQIAVEIEGYFL